MVMIMAKHFSKHRRSIALFAGTMVAALMLSAVGVTGAGSVSKAAGDIVIHRPRVSSITDGPLNHGMVAGVTRSRGTYTEYKTLAEAFGTTKNDSSSTIKLFADVELSDMIWVDGSAKGVTLDMKGHKIRRSGASRSSNGGIFGLESGAELTIIDSDKNGSTISNGSSSNTSGGFQVKDGAKLTMTGVRIEHMDSTDKGGAIYNDGGTVDLKGVTISECSSYKDGGAIYHNKGQMYIRDCVIQNCKSEKDGGAIAINGENVMMYENKILSNFADGDGGGIWVNDSKVFIAGGEIKHNMADYGGGIYVDSKYDINIQGKLIIEDNHTTSNRPSDLVLQDGIASGARAYDGGLLPGSRVGIDKTKSVGSGYKAVMGITDYEIKNGYVFVNRGHAELRDTTKREEVFMATAVDEYGWGIVLLIVLEIIGAVFLVKIMRKRRG
ncbi:MAG: hypothetical protein IJS24_07560 [Eubacterium sp.]|nr:hypothetical protein [Eubacterium sp.]